MIKNYKISGLNWCTFYDSRGNLGCIENNNKITVQRPCFHDTYPRVHRDVVQHIKIAIKKGTDQVSRYNNHYCPFSYKRIVEHINYLKEIFDFNYTIENYYDQYIIDIDFNGKGIYFRIMVTWIRYLYEFPANMALKDVYRIKSLPEFKDIDIFSLSTFVLDSLFASYYFDDHLCNNTNPSELITTEQLKDRIRNLLSLPSDFKTMDIFKPTTIQKQIAIARNRSSLYTAALDERNIAYTDGSYMRNMYDWLNKDLFKLRLNLYRENLKLLK